MHSWKMIDFLMMLHFHKSLRYNMPICPPEIPFCILFVFLYFKFQLFTYFGKYIVNTVWIIRKKYTWDINNYPIEFDNWWPVGDKLWLNRLTTFESDRLLIIFFFFNFSIIHIILLTYLSLFFVLFKKTKFMFQVFKNRQ